MSQDIRKVNDMESLITYFSEKLNWNIDPDDFYDIDDITYEFEAEDLGLKDEAFAKINSLKQLQPLVDDQKWGIFFVEFDSQRFEVSALRKILSGLIPTRRNSAEHAVWDKRDLLFLCTWGSGNQTTIGAAHFEDAQKGLPQIKMISCEPSVEDFTQINIFEQKLAKLRWPSNPTDTAAWREAWSSAFTVRYRQVIQDSHTLTVCLAEEAKAIRDRILSTLKVETRNGYVHLLFEKFQNTLIHDMTEQQFADMYAQTIVYGLFSARCMDSSQDDFSPEEAVACIPNTNPFLKSLMQECFSSDRTGSKLSFDELEIGNIVTLLQNTKTDAIIADFNRQTGGGREDPVIHFYEEFLTEYDKEQKVQRGVYYTPQPVVNFIVRAVDDILKSEFGIADGLASTETKEIKIKRQSKRKNQRGFYTEVEDTETVPAVQVLDPATGTGTFLRQTILQIYQNFCDARKGMPREQIQKEWNDYVPKHLLPRLNGFELMMAPYAVAHMKLAMVLKDTGYDFHGKERLQVLLTNSLEEPGESENQMSLYYDDPLATESVAANAVKKNMGINVVVGNPPYSGISSNNNPWITQLIEDYKYINGVHFGERKHWLQDDYVKFIRMGESLLEQHRKGILAYINNHSFLSNPTFRCMRYHLMQTFDEIYILNLHGNSLIGELCFNGRKDENVFDIQQGVSINIFIKRAQGDRKSLARVYYADCYGDRISKYDWLASNSFSTVEWKELIPVDPYFFFVEKTLNNTEKYNSGFSVAEIFKENVMGITTARDSLVIDSDRDQLQCRIRHFCDLSFTDDEIRTEFFPGKSGKKYLPGDTRGWKLSHARRAIQQYNHDEIIRPISYRPFDKRYIYYCHEMVDWDRVNVMHNFMEGPNYGLAVVRINRDDLCTALITDEITDKTIISSKDNANIFPLYLYENEKKTANLNSDIILKLCKKVDANFSDSSDTDDHNSITPLSILDYIYAILYCPSYRSKYADLIRSEFPRIPYPEDADSFWQLVSCGKRLREIHLLTSSELEGANYPFYGSGDNTLVKAMYKNGAIYINKTQHFDGIDEQVWNEYIGAYQPLQKWMKDRKGTILTGEDIGHYQKMISAMKLTQNIMAEIDKIVQF